MYQSVRENYTYIVFAVMTVIYLLTDLLELADEGSSDVSGSYMFVLSADGMPFILNMLALIYTAVICGGDMIDRTMNYELLDGAKRSDVYFSRFLVGLFWSLVSCTLILVLPIAAVSAAAGWGKMLTVGAAARRTLFLLAPIIRLVSFYTLLTFLITDYRAVIGIGFVLGQGELIAVMLIQESGSLGIDEKLFDFLALPSLTRIFDVANIGFGYENGEDFYIVKQVMNLSDDLRCAAINLVIAAVYVVAGYLIFRKRDVK